MYLSAGKASGGFMETLWSVLLVFTSTIKVADLLDVFWGKSKTNKIK